MEWDAGFLWYQLVTLELYLQIKKIVAWPVVAIPLSSMALKAELASVIMVLP
jgi:hypothetical protein